MVFCGVLALVEGGHEVAGRANMRCGIAAVGGEADFNRIVLFHREIERGWLAHFVVVGQYHDALVRGAELQLVFGANHAFAHLAAYLALLDGDMFVANPKFGVDGGHKHLLAGSHVGRAANDVQRFLAAHIHGGDVQMVGVGVVDAGEHLAHDHAFQGTFHRLKTLEVFHFKARRSQQFADLLRRIIAIDVLFQPVIRNLHFS